MSKIFLCEKKTHFEVFSQNWTRHFTPSTKMADNGIALATILLYHQDREFLLKMPQELASREDEVTQSMKTPTMSNE